MKIVGSYVSPYVRKVLACLALKGLAYEIDPITPFFGGEAFERLSPLRRIPVLVDGDLTLCDSSAICAYLDEAYPEPPLLPADVRNRARARWIEEYADTRLGDVFIWGLFYQSFVRPAVFQEEGDGQVHLVALYVAVLDQDVHVLHPATLHAAQRARGAVYPLPYGILEALRGRGAYLGNSGDGHVCPLPFLLASLWRPFIPPAGSR